MLLEGEERKKMTSKMLDQNCCPDMARGLVTFLIRLSFMFMLWCLYLFVCQWKLFSSIFLKHFSEI